jgi:hypothetical protein
MMSTNSEKLLTLPKVAELLKRPGQTADSCYYSIRHCIRKNKWRPSMFIGNAYVVKEEELPSLRAALEALTRGRPSKSRGMYLRTSDTSAAADSEGEPERASS